MHATRDVAAWEPAGRVLRASLPRPWRPRQVRRAVTPGSVASVLLHVVLVAVLLLAPPAPEPAEEAVAPSFAIDFTDGAPAAPSPTPPSPQPQVNLGGPEAEAMPPPRDEPSEPLPVPPRPRRYGSALRPRPDRNPFAHVMPFDLSQQSSRSVASSSLGRGLDLSAGPVVRNGALQDSVVHVMGSHGVSDWGERLQAFVEEHKYYPQAAAENGEQGNAVLRVTVNRDGTVKSLTLVSSSGSHLLDAAWMAVFRDNRLPAFNDDMAGKQITFNYELDYSLIYGHR